MKKTTIAIMVLSTLIFVNKSEAQKKGFVSLSLGTANPLGDFGSKEVTNDKAGLANLGLVIDLTAGYIFHDNIGGIVMLRSQANPIDGQVFADALAKQLPSGITSTYSVKSWAIGSFLIGPFGSFKLSEKFDFQPKILVGATSISNPEINVNFSNNSWVKQASTNASGFGYLIGAGVKYNMGERWCLSGNVDYTGASIDFKDVTTTTSAGTTQKSNITINFASINTTIGIGYKF